MARIAFISIVLSICSGSTSGAPVPPGAYPPIYFPTQVGTRWVYLYPSSQEGIEIIKNVERCHECSVVTIEYFDENGKSLVQVLSVSREKVCVIEDWVCKYGDPLPWVKTAAKPRDSWQIATWYKFKGADKYAVGKAGTFTYLRTEKVKVPAGEFQAMCIEARGIMGWSETRWYAPGVGLVKRINNANQTIVLKSFVLGGNIAPPPREVKH